MSRVIGLDVASNTGAVVRGVDSDYMDWKLFTVDKKDPWMKRASWLGANVADYAKEQEADLAIIEGYSYLSSTAMGPLITMGTMVRYFLELKGIKYVEVAPGTLKKFVAGRGNAKKDEMRLAVYKIWKFENDSLDVIDAFGLAEFGVELVAPGIWNNPKWQEKVVLDWAKKQKK